MRIRPSHLTLLVLCLAIHSPSIGAEEAAHERVGVKDKAPIELSLELGLCLRPLAPTLGLELDGDLAIELLVASWASFRLGLPLGIRLGGDPSRFPAWAADLGDLALSLGGQLFRGPWQFGWGIDLSLPLLPSETGAGRSRGLSLGLGFPALSLSTSVARFLDPLVLALSLGAMCDFPPPEFDATVLGPFEFQAGFQAMEALNGRASLGLFLQARLRSPLVFEGLWESFVWAYSVDAGFSLLILIGEGSLRLSFSGPESPRLEARGAYVVDMGRAEAK